LSNLIFLLQHCNAAAHSAVEEDTTTSTLLPPAKKKYFFRKKFVNRNRGVVPLHRRMRGDNFRAAQAELFLSARRKTASAGQKSSPSATVTTVRTRAPLVVRAKKGG
jgi:hypothetical protein